MIEYRKRYVCPFCARSTIYKLEDGMYSCKKCSVKFHKPAVKTIKVSRQINVCKLSYRTGPAEAAEIRRQLKAVHEMHPEYNSKQLARECFCGRNIVESYLKEVKQ